MISGGDPDPDSTANWAKIWIDSMPEKWKIKGNGKRTGTGTGTGWRWMLSTEGGDGDSERQLIDKSKVDGQESNEDKDEKRDKDED